MKKPLVGNIHVLKNVLKKMGNKMKKNCYICGQEYEDSKVAIIGESKFCPICRRIKDKVVLYALSSLSKQIGNISKRIVQFHKKELENEDIM